jgi:hypothetical protein
MDAGFFLAPGAPVPFFQNNRSWALRHPSSLLEEWRAVEARGKGTPYGQPPPGHVLQYTLTPAATFAVTVQPGEHPWMQSHWTAPAQEFAAHSLMMAPPACVTHAWPSPHDVGLHSTGAHGAVPTVQEPPAHSADRRP